MMNTSEIEEEIDRCRTEFSFMKNYRIILNLVIEEEVNDVNFELIKVNYNFKIEF